MATQRAVEARCHDNGIGEGQEDLADLGLHGLQGHHGRDDKDKGIVDEQSHLPDHGWKIAEGIGIELGPPGIERRLEIQEGNVERPLVHGGGVLEGRDDHPIDGKKHKE